MTTLKQKSQISNGAIEKKLKPRRRPGDSQREQKEITRRKLLDTAQIVFEHYPYSEVAVEMLAEYAEVSRTTFYRHFDGKVAVVLALFEDLAPLLKEHWQLIFDNPKASLDDIRDWVEGLMKVSFSNPVLNRIFVQIEAIEPDVQANKFRYYDQIMSMLPLEGIDNKELERIRARFVLLMLQIDQFLNLARFEKWVVKRTSLINAMAELIHDFMAVVDRRA